jgi:WD40 repeat protein
MVGAMKPVGHDDLSALPPAELSSEPTVGDAADLGIEDGEPEVSGDLGGGSDDGEPSSSGPTLGEPAIAARRARDASAPAFPNQQRNRQRYKFLGEHGRGGIGRVLKAHDRDLGRQVAIKELLSRGQAHEARFFREVEITARLEHPGIVPVHEAGRWSDGTPFYAMKLVSGRPLRDLLAERPTVEDRLGLLHHVIAVADAIAYAHERRIIHRDLKPANIIVGDFGETVVIDWGLAKDLTVSEESSTTSSDGTPRVPTHASNHELTIAGAVLGTPAYMAPEQKYGEQVDQRADVYAIGTMLWELCAIQKVPPTDPTTRYRLLRDAGIDDDFATIINKALEPDPERRYADAGALAADLKAFKAGARIAARSYSLYAMLAHWTRRHRRIALSVAAVIVAALVGTFVYVRNIAIERDRADAQERLAVAAQNAAQGALDELTLNHAQLLLTTDPSAAIDAIKTYQGSNTARAAQIRTEAQARGLAFVRALPHSDYVSWMKVAPDGSIFTLSQDGTIARTSLAGMVSVVAHGVTKSCVPGYNDSLHLLAYTCDPADLCLFDIARNERVPTAPAFRGLNASAVSFAPHQALLSVLSRDHVLHIFDVKDPMKPVLRLTKLIEGAVDGEFTTDDMVVTGSETGLEFVNLNGDTETFAFPGIQRWNVSKTHHAIGLSNPTGQAIVLEDFSTSSIVRAELCHGPVGDIQIMAGRRAAYSCRSGTVGIWDLEKGTVTPRAQIDGHVDIILVSDGGDYLIAAAGTGTVTILDLYTGLTASYIGHKARPTAMVAPTPEHPFLVTADAHGGVRAWQLPPRLARIIANSPSPFLDAIFDRATRTLVATTRLSGLSLISLAASMRKIEPHDESDMSLVASAAGTRFVTYGINDAVEMWAPETMTRTRLLATGHGSVSQLHFIADSDEFLTAGHDGRIARWRADGTSQTVVQIKQPIDKFVATPEGVIVFSTLDGGLWRTVVGADPVAIRPGGARVNRLLAVPGQPLVYAGMASGDVTAINTQTWEQVVVLHGAGTVQDLVFTDDGRTVAVATSDGNIHLATPSGPVTSAKDLTWDVLGVHANHILLAPDGLLVAPSTEGTIWLYATAQRRSLCIVVGTADFTGVVATADGKTVATIDRDGRVMSIDLEAARKLLNEQAAPVQPR